MPRAAGELVFERFQTPVRVGFRSDAFAGLSRRGSPVSATGALPSSALGGFARWSGDPNRLEGGGGLITIFQKKREKTEILRDRGRTAW